VLSFGVLFLSCRVSCGVVLVCCSCCVFVCVTCFSSPLVCFQPSTAAEGRNRANSGGVQSYHTDSYRGRGNSGGALEQYRGGRELRDSGVGTDPARPRSKAEAYMELMRGEGLARSIAELLSEVRMLLLLDTYPRHVLTLELY